MEFFERLNSVCKRKNSQLCVGIDPNPLVDVDLETFLQSIRAHDDSLKSLSSSDLEKCVRRGDAIVRNAVYEYLRLYSEHLVQETAESAVAYKLNSAFFEQFGSAGIDSLKQSIKQIKSTTDALVILDCKRGDIGSTAEAYANFAYDVCDADSVTLNPYMGTDSMKPFLRPGKGIFLLCKTSNPSSQELQTLNVNDDLFLYEAVIKRYADNPQQIGFVVGATDSEAINRFRKICKKSWILAPGVGAQGGDLDTICQFGKNDEKSGILIPISRGISKQGKENYACIAKQYKDNINKALYQ